VQGGVRHAAALPSLYYCNTLARYAHSDSVAIKDAMLKADVIVFDIVHAQKEATAALKILLKAEYEEEKTLIAVSSILSWADTPAPKPAEDDEPVEEVAGEEAVEGQPPPKAPEPAGPAITYVVQPFHQ
jgi:hypothetical protein